MSFSGLFNNIPTVAKDVASSAIKTQINNKLSKLGVLRQVGNFLNNRSIYESLLASNLGPVFKITAQDSSASQAPIHLYGILQNELSFSFSAQYGLLAEAELMRVTTDNIVDTGVQGTAGKFPGAQGISDAIASSIKDRFNVNRSYTTRRWDNTSVNESYLVLPLEFTLLAINDSQQDVIQKLQKLTELVLPKDEYDANAVNVTNKATGYKGDYEFLGPYGSKEGPNITFTLGDYFHVEDLIASSINMSLSREIMVDGYPAYANMSLTLETRHSISSRDFGTYFNSTTGGKDLESQIRKYVGRYL